MYEERPIAAFAAYMLAATVGAGMVFAFQKYGEYTAQRAEDNLREQMKKPETKAGNA